jgi:hypothetical protein
MRRAIRARTKLASYAALRANIAPPRDGAQALRVTWPEEESIRDRGRYADVGTPAAVHTANSN